MLRSKGSPPDEDALGMNAGITRRDFLGSTLLASGALLLEGIAPDELLTGGDEFSGYGGVGEYSRSNGNTLEVLLAGHKMRDGAYDPLPADAVDTGETYDCVIVGGGISGLAAALFFLRHAGPGKSVLILENHPIFGGEAKQNEFQVDGKRLIAHQGSAIYLVPYPHSFIARFYNSIGLHTPRLQYQKWAGAEPEMVLGRTPYDSAGLNRGQYGFWFGAKFGRGDGLWLLDPIGKQMQGAPVAETTRKELQRWFSGKAAEEAKFDLPKYEGDAPFPAIGLDVAGATLHRAFRCDPGDDSHLLVTGGGRRIWLGARCALGVLRLRGGLVTPV